MHIEELQLSGFGHFFERRFGPFDSPITVFVGPNEAGKSTLLAFIRAALFGFPARQRERFYPALRGGEHGGRLRFRDTTGRRYVVEVRERTRAIGDDAGQAHDLAVLQRALGHASRDVFESVFAFGLDELQDMKSLDKDEAARYIYAAGTGAARVPAAIANFARARDELFKPQGRNPQISRKLAEIEALEGQLRLATTQSAQYAALSAAIRALTAQTAESEEELTGLERRRTQLNRHFQAFPDWAELQDKRRRLKAMPAFAGFPPDALARLATLEQQADAAERELAAARDLLGEHRLAAGQEVPNAGLLASSGAIAAITRRLGDAAHSIDDLPKRQTEHTAEARRLAGELRDLGPGWDAERLAAATFDIPTTAQVHDHARAIDDARQLVRDAQAALGQARQERDDAMRTFERLQAACHDDADATPPPSPQTIREARSVLHAATRAQERLGDLERLALPPQSRAGTDGRARATLLGVVAVAAVAVGALAGGLALLLGAGAAVGCGAAWLAGRRGPHPATATDVAVEEARAAAVLASTDLQRAAHALDLEEVSEATLDELDLRAAAFARDWLERQHAEQARDGAAEALQRAEQRLASALDSLEKAGLATSGAAEAWAAWLEQRYLASTLTPPAALDLFRRIEGAQAQARQVAAIAERVRKIEADIASFRVALHPFVPEGGALRNGQLLAFAETLIERHDAARAAAADRSRAAAAATAAERDCERREQQRTQARSRLAELLANGGASSPDELRARAASHDDRAKLAGRVQQLETNLTRLAGPVGIEALDLALQGVDGAALEESLAGAESAAEAVQRRLQQLRDERAHLEAERNGLASDEHASLLRAQHAEMLEELRALAHDWARYAIAGHLLERARDQYQAERQPAVVAHAQAFFETVTGGRYDRIVTALGQQSIVVRAADGAIKTPLELSRGTREQLYLALRFGLVRQFNEQETNLPVIVDDILVNFDPGRAEHTVQALVELSRTNQVLVFTCQPATARLFKAASRSTQLVDMAENESPAMARLL